LFELVSLFYYIQYFASPFSSRHGVLIEHDRARHNYSTYCVEFWMIRTVNGELIKPTDITVARLTVLLNELIILSRMQNKKASLR